MKHNTLASIAREHLTIAADAIAEMGPGLQAGWCIYLLEALDPGSDRDDDFRAMLDGVARSITIRLESGRW